jgi:hypothetical protein
MSGDIAGHGIVWTASCCKKMLYNSGSMWPSVVVHEHWPVRARIWRQRKHFISGQPHFGHDCFWGWGVTVWGCFSFDCKLDSYVLDGNLTGQKYRDNVLAPRVVPHFNRS